MLTLLLALACRPATPGPDPEAFARVVLQLGVEPGTQLPTGVAQLWRQGRDRPFGDPPLSIPVSFRDYGPVDFTAREIDVPEGLVNLAVSGFDPTGSCAALRSTGDTAFPCSDDNWFGRTEVWVSDVPPPDSWAWPHVRAGQTVTIDVRMAEGCSCSD